MYLNKVHSNLAFKRFAFLSLLLLVVFMATCPYFIGLAIRSYYHAFAKKFSDNNPFINIQDLEFKLGYMQSITKYKITDKSGVHLGNMQETIKHGPFNGYIAKIDHKLMTEKQPEHSMFYRMFQNWQDNNIVTTIPVTAIFTKKLTSTANVTLKDENLTKLQVAAAIRTMKINYDLNFDYFTINSQTPQYELISKTDTTKFTINNIVENHIIKLNNGDFSNLFNMTIGNVLLSNNNQKILEIQDITHRANISYTRASDLAQLSMESEINKLFYAEKPIDLPQKTVAINLNNIPITRIATLAYKLSDKPDASNKEVYELNALFQKSASNFEIKAAKELLENFSAACLMLFRNGNNKDHAIYKDDVKKFYNYLASAKFILDTGNAYEMSIKFLDEKKIAITEQIFPFSYS